MDYDEFKILIIGVAIFAIFPIFYLKRTPKESKRDPKRNFFLKLPFLGALIALTLSTYFGEQVVWSFYFFCFILQLLLIFRKVTSEGL